MERQALHQDTVTAWEDFEETGLHATGNEVMDGLVGSLGNRERVASACMPQVRIASAALRDLERLSKFSRPKEPDAAESAGGTVVRTEQVLQQRPMVDPLVESPPHEFR